MKNIHSQGVERRQSYEWPSHNRCYAIWRQWSAFKRLSTVSECKRMHEKWCEENREIKNKFRERKIRRDKSVREKKEKYEREE